MALSFLERKLVENIKKDFQNKKIDRRKMSLLTIEGVKELLSIPEYKNYINYLNKHTIIDLIDMFTNDSFNNFTTKERKEICSNILLTKNFNFCQKLLLKYPEYLTYYCVSHKYIINQNINKFTDQEIKTILDMASYSKDIKDGLGNDMNIIVLLINRLKDNDKNIYLKKYSIYSEVLYDEIFSNYTSREELIKGISIYLQKQSWFNINNIKKYLTDEELFSLVDERIAEEKHIYHISAFFDFNLNYKIHFIETMIKCNQDHYNVKSLVKNVIEDAIKNKKNIDIYEQIYLIYKKNNKEMPDLKIDETIAEHLDSLTPSEILSYYKNKHYKSLKEFIKSNTNYWLREPMFSYLVNNEPDFIYHFMKSYENFSIVKQEENLFLSKNTIERLVTTLDCYISFYNDITDKISIYFKDDSFCYKTIEQNPKALPYCLLCNPNPEFISFAFSKGLKPDRETYYACKNVPSLLEVYLSNFKNFDYTTKEFPNVFNNLATIQDDRIIKILLEQAAANISISSTSFATKFESLKKVNREILSTFDYRLFSEKFSFLSMNKIEQIGAHKNISTKLCSLSPEELKIIEQIINFSSSVNWVDLLDRLLTHISEYQELIKDLYNKELNINLIKNLTQMLIQSNSLNIKNYNDLINYDELINKKINTLVQKENVTSYKEAISLELLGIEYQEFYRLYIIYCSELESFCNLTNNEDLKKILTLISNVCSCDSFETIKEIYYKTPKIKVSAEFLINLDTEIRKEFAKFYNDTLYRPIEEDKIKTINYQEVIDENNKSNFIESGNNENIQVSLYSPIGLFDEQKEFALMMTSLGAYSEQKTEPDDYYANWNINLINSHGFCCSYLTNDNLGTARICHACLGFTDFAPESLLLSAPYDIGSSHANTEFNTSRKLNSKFCTPRKMADRTRHTHNEVVWERRDLISDEEFKKKPSYVIFFCENLDSLGNEEKRIYNSTIKAAIQLGKKGNPLPVIVVERAKIALFQRKQLLELLNNLITDYKPGIATKIITKFINNKVGSTYAKYIISKYFDEDFQRILIQSMHLKIKDLLNSGSIEEAMSLYNEINETVLFEININKNEKNIEIFIDENEKFKTKIEFLFQIKKNDNSLFKEMIIMLNELDEDNYTQRWKSVVNKLTISNESFISIEKVLPELSIYFQKNNISTQLLELENDSLYKPNTPYDNRHIVNTYLYALMIYLENRPLLQFSSPFDPNPNNYRLLDMNEVFDFIKYKKCSYMDGESQKNILSSALKAEKIMREKNYSQEKIDNIKLLILLQDKKGINDELINSTIKQYNLKNATQKDPEYINQMIDIVHDSECLEHTRFITAGELSPEYFLNKSNFKFAKIAYQIQETYASLDLRNYLKDNSKLFGKINHVDNKKNPQELIRSIRKNKVEFEEHQLNSFEEAFLEITAEEVTDPLNLIEEKMKTYASLPKQLSINEFYSQVVKMPYYSYLIEHLDVKEKLYLDMSEVHGETHANNVSLFSMFIATSLGLSQQDIKTIIEAAIYHDIGRISDNNSSHHGSLGAIKYSTKVSCPSNISVNEVKFLIEAHALPSITEIKKLFERYSIPKEEQGRLYQMATIIRDADALDRTRFKLIENTNNLKSEFLVHDISKQLIEASQRLNNIIYKDFINSKIAYNQIMMTN